MAGVFVRLAGGEAGAPPPDFRVESMLAEFEKRAAAKNITDGRHHNRKTQNNRRASRTSRLMQSRSGCRRKSIRCPFHASPPSWPTKKKKKDSIARVLLSSRANLPTLTAESNKKNNKQHSPFFFFTGLGLGLGLDLAAGLFLLVTTGDFLLAGDVCFVAAGDFFAALLGFGDGLFPVLARFCQDQHKTDAGIQRFGTIELRGGTRKTPVFKGLEQN